MADIRTVSISQLARDTIMTQDGFDLAGPTPRRILAPDRGADAIAERRCQI